MTFHAKPAIRYFARPALLVLIFSLGGIALLYDFVFARAGLPDLLYKNNIAQGILFLISALFLNVLSIFLFVIYFVELH